MKIFTEILKAAPINFIVSYFSFIVQTNQTLQTETPRKYSQLDNTNRNSTKVKPIKQYKQKLHESEANQTIQTENLREYSQSDITNRNSMKVQSIR